MLQPLLPLSRSGFRPGSFRGIVVAALCAAVVPLCIALDTPVSPNAIPAVGTLLNFLDSTRGNYIVSGQQERSWDRNGLDFDINYIIANTGKTPAVRGFDFLEYVYSPSQRAGENATERAITWAKNGGIVTFCCHMFVNIGSTNGQPQFYVPSAGPNGQGTNFDIRQAVISGTPENTEFLAKLDIIASELTKLRDAGVPVIWRPFHECGGTWFWWSAHGSAPYITAYQLMFNRFTQMHGLTNLIWVFNPIDSSTTMQNWYPGDNYVDMIALDTYPGPGTHPTFAAESNQMRDFKNGRKVVAMSECGTIPDPDLQFSQGAVWSYFCTWNGFENDLTRNSVAYLNTVYNHPKVITLDELPSFYVLFSLAFTTQPVSQTVTAGAPVTFTAAASGTPAPTFQWQKDSVNITGATGTSYTIASVASGDAGAYRVVATNSVSSATSNAVTLTVNVAPVITTQPVSQTVITGKAVTFTAAASGTPAPTFQWQKDNVNINGAINSSYTIASVALGDAGTYLVTATNAAGSVASNPATLIVHTPSGGDFNGDNQTDVLWQNTLTGQRALWLMNGIQGGFTPASIVDLGFVTTGWVIAGTGDFNGDNQADILWQNTITGQRALWLMNGIQSGFTPASIVDLGYVTTDWEIAGTGDFNADNQADILWQNTVTGQRALWLMNGIQSGFTPASIVDLGYVTTDWEIAGTGDFNSDNQTDILWQNAITGQRALWLMNGINSGFTPASIVDLGFVTIGWVIAGTGDFNSDGQTDILWQNTVTGQRALWLMNGINSGFTPASIVDLGFVTTDWVIAN